MSGAPATVLTMSDEAYPFQRLDDRLAGKAIDDVLLAGVPEHLVHAVSEWVDGVLSKTGGDGLARSVMLSLQWDPGGLRWGWTGALMGQPADELLTVVDAILQVNPRHDVVDAYDAEMLRRLLWEGRSAYRIADDHSCLVYRVDPTVEGAFKDAVAKAPATASELLAKAWYHAYRPEPDPTAAYREAVRAVEQLACPLVLPSNPKATLGTVIAHLRDAPDKWSTVLTDKDGNQGDPAPVRELMNRLWTGQLSRHGGGASSREQTQEEAEAAVHAAVLLVQWLAADVLTKKP
jgi:hypothetical protein